MCNFFIICIFIIDFGETLYIYNLKFFWYKISLFFHPIVPLAFGSTLLDCDSVALHLPELTGDGWVLVQWKSYSNALLSKNDIYSLAPY